MKLKRFQKQGFSFLALALVLAVPAKAWGNVAFFGRDTPKYKAMYCFSDQDFEEKVLLDVASGPSTFIGSLKEKEKLAASSLAVDLQYGASAEDLRALIDAGMKRAFHPYFDQSYLNWEKPRQEQFLEKFEEYNRIHAEFLRLYRTFPEIYVKSDIRKLRQTLGDHKFDLIISSNLLFLYAEEAPFDEEFHFDAIGSMVEMLSEKGELRIFPLDTLKAKRPSFYASLLQRLKVLPIELEVRQGCSPSTGQVMTRQVDQKGEMLVIRKKSEKKSPSVLEVRGKVMAKKIPYWQVDAFTNQPFQGNPAAVFVLQEDLDEELMQKIAMEMNLSESAFIFNRGENRPPLLRWFTPTMEIDLCGHATIAATHVFLNEIYPDRREVTFDTKFVGLLRVVQNETGYTMDFPSRLGEKVSVDKIPEFVIQALGQGRPVDAYQSRDLMLVFEDEKSIYNMKPDFNALKDFKEFLIVTAHSQKSEYDFVSRFFCADEGISEDPVTGSAHCTSGPYWANKLKKSKLRAYQASKRGGELDLELKGDRILISGSAVTVSEGKLVLR